MGARLASLDGRPGVQRMRRADHHGFGPSLAEHGADIGERARAIGGGESLRPFGTGIADGDEIRFRQACQRLA